MKEKNTVKALAFRYGAWFAGGILAAFAAAVMTIFSNDIIADAMDKMLSGRQDVELVWAVICILILGAVGMLAAFLQMYMAKMYSVKVQTEFKNRAAEKIPDIEYRYFDEKGSGSIMNKLISDIREMDRLFSETLPGLALSVIIVASVMVYLTLMDWKLSLTIIVAYPIILGLADNIANKVKKLADIRRGKLDERTEIAYDCVQGIVVGKSYNLEERQDKRIGRVIEEVFRNEKKRTQTSTMAYVLESTIGWMPTVICYIFALFEVLNHQITVGDMLAFSVLLGRVSRNIESVPMYIIELKECMVSVKRLNELMSAKEEPSGEYSTNSGPVAVAFENVVFAYEKEEEGRVLNGVSFQAETGKQTAIIGSSGGGKSTIFKLICGFYPVCEGVYKLYGEDFSRWDLSAARQNFSLVSQNVFLLPESVGENVGYGRENATMEEIVEACKNANIHDFIMSLPAQYDTLVGERGVRLSGGERQRISIARAFLKNAPILLLDEPTAAIDVATEQLIQEAIDRISENKTVILIAHRLNTVVKADKILVLDEGKIAEEGSHQELLERGGIYAQLYGKQMRGGEADEA